MTLFTRDGSIHTGSFHTDAKGAFTLRTKKCSRCGGAGGADKWKFTGWTCFDCGGKGTAGTETIRLFDAEKLAKLNATAAKRNATQAIKAQAKADAAQVEADARRNGFLALHGDLIAAAEPFVAKSSFVGDLVRKAHQNAFLSDAQVCALAACIQKIAEVNTAEAAAKAKAAASQHVGTVGERIEAQVTVERIASFPRPSFSGRGLETVWVITMRDSQGNTLVSKSPSFHAEKGASLKIKGTIKEHGEFRDERQTVLQRISVR